MRLLRIAAFVLVLICQCHAEKQLFCPNNGIPKSDIKCLPGQTDVNVCGDGFSCFFSGQNYHCCPTGDESEDESVRGECPDYTVALLDAVGKPIRCSSLGNQCPPGKNTYCNENSPVPICCQNLNKQNDQQQNNVDTQKQQELQAVEDFFNEDHSSTVKQEKVEEKAEEKIEESLDCPKNSLTVLNEDGEPTICSSDSECPQSGMFCHGNVQKTCCESIETVGTTKEPNSLNIRPNSTESPKATTNNQTTTSSVTSKTTESKPSVTLSTLITTQSTAEPQPIQNNKTGKIGLSEATYKNEQSADKNPTKQTNPKIFASKTANFDDDGKPVKYRPHASGGYAVSQTINKLSDSDHVNKKEIVQQYLLEQIKQGWPYDEKFFRPENTAVIQNGGRPTTVVHFP